MDRISDRRGAHADQARNLERRSEMKTTLMIERAGGVLGMGAMALVLATAGLMLTGVL